MNPTRKTAVTLGVYFLSAFILGITGIIVSRLFDPAFTSSHELFEHISEDPMRLKMSVLFDLLATVSVVGLSTTLFITLKDYNKSVAWMGLGCWFLYMGVGLASRIHVFSLLQLNHEYMDAGVPGTDYFFTLGNLKVAEANSGYLILEFFFRVGGLAFYYLFLMSRIIPRFLSLWGLAAMVLGLGSFFMEFFDYYPGNVNMILSIPNIIFEPFIGLWLIVKGFSTPGSPGIPKKPSNN